MFKRITVLFLALVLAVSITACGGGNAPQNQQNTVSYTETEIGSNSGLIWPGGSRINSRNQLVVLDRNDGMTPAFVTLDKDGKPAGTIKCSFSGYIAYFALDAQDNIYALTGEEKNGSLTPVLEVMSPSGETLKSVDLGTASDAVTNGGLSDMAIGPDGSIYLAAQSGILVLDKDGKTVKTLGSQGYSCLDTDSDGKIIAVCMGMGKYTLDKLDPATGQIVWSIDLMQNAGRSISMGSDKVRVSKKDNSIYRLTQQGIAKYDSSGKSVGTALDFASYTILASGYRLSDLSVDSSGNIYVTTSTTPEGKMQGPGIVNEGPSGKAQAAAGPQGSTGTTGSGPSDQTAENDTSDQAVMNGAPGDTAAGPNMIPSIAPGSIKYELYKYSVQTGSPSQNKKTITVSVPMSNRTLEMAAAKFQKDHPDYKINIQTYPAQDNSGGDYDTYVKNLNTQILSGNGPDIISVAGLPFNNYISKNVLVNLSDLIAGDKSFDMSKYYTNIFDALKTNGSLYVLPTDFVFDVMMANRGILDEESINIDDSKWTWDDFKAIAEKVSASGNRTALPSIAPMDLLNMLTEGSFSGFVNTGGKSADFASQEFINLLNIVKELSGNNSDSSGKSDMITVLQAAMRGELVFYPNTIADYGMYGFMKSAYNNQLSLYSMPTANGSGGGTFTSGSLYAINSNSKYKSESWELLKTLISDDVQSAQASGGVSIGKAGGKSLPGVVMGGFSINKAAQQKKAQFAIDMAKSGKGKMMMQSPSGSIELNPAQMTQADIDLVNKLISGLNTYANVDANIYNIVQDETASFFSGGKTAEDVAKLIQDRANTYLGE